MSILSLLGFHATMPFGLALLLAAAFVLFVIHVAVHMDDQ